MKRWAFNLAPALGIGMLLGAWSIVAWWGVVVTIGGIVVLCVYANSAYSMGLAKGIEIAREVDRQVEAEEAAKRRAAPFN